MELSRTDSANDSNEICATLLVCIVCILKQNAKTFVAIVFMFIDFVAILGGRKLLLFQQHFKLSI
jgi:hypothetical protein